MDWYSLDGSWWLPQNVHQRFFGRLTFDADGVLLSVDGILAEGQGPAIHLGNRNSGPQSIDCVLGRTKDGEFVSLLDAVAESVTYGKGRQATYRIRTAVRGTQTTSDNFDAVRVQFDSLAAWVEPPPIVEWGVPPDSTHSLRFKELDLAQAQVQGTVIKLQARTVGTISDNAVQCRQEVSFSFEHEPSAIAGLVDRWVRPLQDLLVFALGRPVRISTLRVRPVGGKAFGEASYDAVQPTPRSGLMIGAGKLKSRSASTLLMFKDSPLPFSELIPRWFALRAEVSEVLILLHSPYYADFMFSENRFATTFQSAEALAHARGLSGREKSRAEHRNRVNEVITAARNAGVDPQAIEWAERILRSRNDKPLSAQIEDLVLSTGEVGQAVILSSPEFGKLVASARTGVSHGGATQKLDAAAREWHGDILRWVIRARLLADLGVPSTWVESRILSKARFNYSLERVKGYADSLNAQGRG